MKRNEKRKKTTANMILINLLLTLYYSYVSTGSITYEIVAGGYYSRPVANSSPGIN